MKTIGEVIALATKYLQEQSIAAPRLQVEELLADVLDCSRLDLYLQFDHPLSENELNLLREKLRKRAKGEPLGYLLSKVEFFTCTLKLSPDVLIPRQETEILLEKIVEKLSLIDLDGKYAWDLCSGSGCLGIALKKTLPLLDVTIADLSCSALEVAKANAQANQVELSFLQGDLLKPFLQKKADVVICNPPYISVQEYMHLDKEVRDFEPRLALVGGASGVEFYGRLAAELPEFLNSGAKVFFEIGAGQAEAILKLFHQSHWRNRCIEKDWAGHDRFFFLEFE